MALPTVVPTILDRLAQVPRAPDSLSAQSGHWLGIKPYAEPSYRTYALDYASRIPAAYGYVNAMFQTETDIDLSVYSIWAGPWNFNAINNCGGVGDAGLENYRGAWVASHLFNGPNAYSLFHAIDGQASWAGCGANSQLQNRHTLETNKDAVHAVYAKDWAQFPADLYDPDVTSHLGLAVGHELTHNAGEWQHPSDGTCPNTNLMGPGPFQCRNAWRTATTQQRVETYSWPRT